MRLILRLALCISSFLCCVHGVEARTAERDDLAWVQVTAVQKANGKTLRVRGCPFSSNSSFSKPIIRIRGSEVWLRNGLGVLRKGVGFDLDITVPNNVDRLVFGNERKTIWPYDEGAIPLGNQSVKAVETAKNAFRKNFPSANLDDFQCCIGNTITSAQRIPVIFFEKENRSGLHRIYSYVIRKEDFRVDKIYKSDCSLSELKSGEIPTNSEEIHPPE